MRPQTPNLLLAISFALATATACTSSPQETQPRSSFATACDDETSGLSAEKIYYVAPDGSEFAKGDKFTDALSFNAALNRVKAGEMILLEPGNYPIAFNGQKNTIKFSKSGSSNAPITVVTANCGRAVFDFSFPEKEWLQSSYGFYVTGNYWYFKGIDITRAGYQGAYVTGDHNTFENTSFHHNRNTGLEINKGGSNTTVINSDAYFNYDPKKSGSMADGFGPKQKQGPGNKFYGCRAWNNSDDGFDMYDSAEEVIIENSWAFNNGVDTWHYGGFRGNGNGFKLGGKFATANNSISNSVAFNNPLKGFDQNNNTGGISVINNISYKNGINYGFANDLKPGEQHYFSNNISLESGVEVSNSKSMNNSWDEGLAATKSDFISLDLNYATIAREPDGTLPETPLFRLSPSSKLIDAGKINHLPYNGKAPDLGAFESK